MAGASTIVAIDPLANKRDMAARLGATHTVNPADGDVGEQVKSLTNGRGADYSFEAVGLESAINGVFSTKLGPGCRSRRAILKTSTDWLLPTHRSSWPISCNHRWRPPALCGAGSAGRSGSATTASCGGARSGMPTGGCPRGLWSCRKMPWGRDSPCTASPPVWRWGSDRPRLALCHCASVVTLPGPCVGSRSKPSHGGSQWHLVAQWHRPPAELHLPPPHSPSAPRRAPTLHPVPPPASRRGAVRRARPAERAAAPPGPRVGGRRSGDWPGGGESPGCGVR